MADYKKILVPSREAPDLKKIYPQKRKDSEIKGIIINSALVDLRRIHREYSETDQNLAKLFEAHNKKVRTKSFERLVDVVNLWLFQSLNYE